MTNKIDTKEKFDDLAIDRIQTFALASNQKKCVLALRRTAAGQISDEADGENLLIKPKFGLNKLKDRGRR